MLPSMIFKGLDLSIIEVNLGCSYIVEVLGTCFVLQLISLKYC